MDGPKSMTFTVSSSLNTLPIRGTAKMAVL